jgi:hypothetical protein
MKVTCLGIKNQKIEQHQQQQNTQESYDQASSQLEVGPGTNIMLLCEQIE